jgi:hypothetical protein
MDVSDTFHLTPDFFRAEIIGMFETEIMIDPPTAIVIALVVLPRLIMEIMALHIVMMVAEVTSVEVLPQVRLRCLEKAQIVSRYCLRTERYVRAE